MEYTNATELRIQIEKQLTQLSQMLNISPETGLQFLTRAKWNFEQAQELYFEASEQETITKTNSVCVICYSEFDDTELTKLECGHKYHKACFDTYLDFIAQQPEINYVCPDCSIAIPFSYFSRSQLEQIWIHIIDDLVNNSRTPYRYCPAVNCQTIIKLPNRRRLSTAIRCRCGENVCLQCRDYSHRPLSCQMLAEWNKLTTQELITDVEHRKCPKCQVVIIKNGGCPRITCRCGHSFCWYCSQELITEHFCKCGLYKFNDTSNTISSAEAEDNYLQEAIKRCNDFDDYLDAFKLSVQNSLLSNSIYLMLTRQIRDNYRFLKFYGVYNYLSLRNDDNSDIILSQILIFANHQEELIKLHTQVVSNHELLNSHKFFPKVRHLVETSDRFKLSD